MLKANVIGRELKARLGEQLCERKYKWTILASIFDVETSLAGKEMVAKEIDERETLYVEQAKSLEAEIKMLNDELIRIKRRGNDLKIDVDRYKREEADIEAALKKMRFGTIIWYGHQGGRS